MKLQGLMAGLMIGAAMAQPSTQPPTPLTDPDAYAIYGLLLDSQLWPERSDRLLFIIQETKYQPHCRHSKPAPQVWRPVETDLAKQNIHTWKLLAPLPTTIRYFLVPRADIDADDARLVQKYPGHRQHLPDSVDFAEFSAVGFSTDKKKAMVYGRTRGRGGLYVMERTDVGWVVSSAWGCRWVA